MNSPSSRNMGLLEGGKKCNTAQGLDPDLQDRGSQPIHVKFNAASYIIIVDV